MIRYIKRFRSCKRSFWTDSRVENALSVTIESPDKWHCLFGLLRLSSIHGSIRSQIGLQVVFLSRTQIHQSVDMIQLDTLGRALGLFFVFLQSLVKDFVVRFVGASS